MWHEPYCLHCLKNCLIGIRPLRRFRQVATMGSARRALERTDERSLNVPVSDHPNRAIRAFGIGSTKPFSSLLLDRMPDLEVVHKSQRFPVGAMSRETPTSATSSPSTKVSSVSTTSRTLLCGGSASSSVTARSSETTSSITYKIFSIVSLPRPVCETTAQRTCAASPSLQTFAPSPTRGHPDGTAPSVRGSQLLGIPDQSCP